ncbi:MAG: PQQ-dependent sugar dehydrogenase [Anaerolineales bacterium]|nr:PQQ-dependent sugar dehydrogenase [Anaerolineales bacterium]
MLNSTRRSSWLLALACSVVLVLLAACAPLPTLPEPTIAVTSPASLPGQTPLGAPATLLPTSPSASPIPLTKTPTPRAAASSAPPFTEQAAASLPDPAQASWRLLVEGLQRPVGVTHAGDGSQRLYVLEQDGVVRIVESGRLLPEPFLDIRDRVGSRGSEQGLLGLAFHPNFAQNGAFYVNYTDQQGDTVIARFSATPGNPPIADSGSERWLLTVDQPFANHNGGTMAFGPDGYLYLGLGDGGSGGDPLGNAQSTQTLLGKILRLDVDGGEPYAIPPEAPFADGGGLPEIWALGLRNPWRFAFDHASGDLYIADVGQNAWEEIDLLPAGSPGGVNFGWDFFEGEAPFEGQPPPGASFISPVYTYGHDKGCSVTGGVVYRGNLLPEWQGVYLFGDYCSGLVWGMKRSADGGWLAAELYDLEGNITSFGEDSAGEVLLVTHGGALLRLER